MTNAIAAPVEQKRPVKMYQILQNEPMTNTIAAPVEQKCPHEMLQTPWIILY